MTAAHPSPPSVPGSDWVPLHRADLAFVPRLAVTVETQLAGLAEMCRTKLAGDPQEASITIGHTRFDAAVSVRFANDIIFDIDVTKGEFCLWELDDDTVIGDEADWQAPYRDADLIRSNPPEEFIEEILKDDVASSAEGQANAARLLAFQLWRSLSRDRDLAIRSGSVIIWARIGSPFAPFTMLAPDQWAHLKTVDRALGVVEAPTGERAYSVHFAPSGKNPTGGDLDEEDPEDAATTWLRGQLRSLAPRSKTKDDLFNEINKLWPNMSRRGFERCWASTAKDAPIWRARGRRPEASKKPDTKTRH